MPGMNGFQLLRAMREREGLEEEFRARVREILGTSRDEEALLVALDLAEEMEDLSSDEQDGDQTENANGQQPLLPDQLRSPTSERADCDSADQLRTRAHDGQPHRIDAQFRGPTQLIGRRSQGRGRRHQCRS